MRTGRLRICFFGAILAVGSVFWNGGCNQADGPAEPLGIYLTWQGDPLTTMTVDWHTLAAEGYAPVLEFREQGRRTWTRAAGASVPFPHSDRTVHRIELASLKPATNYEFRFSRQSRVYSFRTMPADLSRPIRFATGGDTRVQQDWMENVNRQAMQYDLDFIVWGGDLAYCNGAPENVGNWYEWFDAIKNTLITPEGRVIPIIVGIGNHEVSRGTRHEEYEQNDAHRLQIAPYFYTLLAFPGQPGYATLDFGSYLSLLLLDTGHSNPIAGAQTEWLERQLAERSEVPHIIPVYHVPGYPSHRPFTFLNSLLVRQLWAPLFERYGVQVAFENHDHTYKRTHPIRGGKVQEDGIVYIGDGAWGVRTRVGDGFGEWYIAKAASARHCILVTLEEDRRHFLMVDEDGQVIDEYEQVGCGRPRTAASYP